MWQMAKGKIRIKDRNLMMEIVSTNMKMKYMQDSVRIDISTLFDTVENFKSYFCKTSFWWWRISL